ncbi:MAG TPA: nucleotide-binding protein [bacterium]|nr:nucleotide-binding protein [bacterium]
MNDNSSVSAEGNRIKWLVRASVTLDRSFGEVWDEYALDSDYEYIKPMLDECRGIIRAISKAIGDFRARSPGDSAAAQSRLADMTAAFSDVVEAVKKYSGDTSALSRFDSALADFRSEITALAVMAGVQTDLPPLEKLPDSGQPTAISTDALPVFIVHGHDQTVKAEVELLVTKLGLKPIVLNEQVSRSNTIIEKLEAHSDVGFAIVLLTPDDVGAAVSESDKLTLRARQNVILELGYSLAKLGRSRVCTLCSGKMDIPSDWSGVVYVPMDTQDAWKLRSAKELKSFYPAVDLNAL